MNYMWKSLYIIIFISKNTFNAFKADKFYISPNSVKIRLMHSLPYSNDSSIEYKSLHQIWYNRCFSSLHILDGNMNFKLEHWNTVYTVQIQKIIQHHTTPAQTEFILLMPCLKWTFGAKQLYIVTLLSLSRFFSYRFSFFFSFTSVPVGISSIWWRISLLRSVIRIPFRIADKLKWTIAWDGSIAAVTRSTKIYLRCHGF